LAIVGIFQAVLLCKTLKFVGRQTHEMKRQRSVMHLQWKALKDQVEMAKNQFSISHRPWVTVSGEIETGLLIFEGTGAKVTVSFALKNGGTAPALETTNMNQGLIFGPLPRTPEETRKVISCDRGDAFLPAGVGTLILPNETYKVHLPLEIPQGQIVANARSQEVWFTICIRYKDEHGNNHGTGLLWRFVSDDGKRTIEPRGAVRGNFERIGIGNESY
jgi:hypothetical protein